MKRIVAAFQNKLEAMKAERNVKRVYRAMETASDNAKDKIEELEGQMADLVETLPTCTDFNGFIQKLSDLIEEKETQQVVVDRLAAIEKYLSEDVKVQETK